MLLSVNISNKSFGSKSLYKDLRFGIQEGEKVGLIGRNGTGKSTILNIITGNDKDYDGEIQSRRGLVVVSSRQEHHGFENKSVLEYIQGDLPEYSELVDIIDNYPETMGDNPRMIQQFSNALERFSHLNYYEIEDELGRAFDDYKIDKAYLHARLSELSGGQRRMVELIKVQRSRGHLALIDEPTNHMDYIAKKSFIKWLGSASEAVLVVTHDRDVLSNVDRIIEIRDGKSFSFKGNYSKYLKTNTNQMVSGVNEYELIQRRITNLKQDVIRFKRLKERSRDPGTIRRFKSQEIKAEEELAKLLTKDKPSFWIDKESTETMNDKLMNSYDKYKDVNIKISTDSKSSDPDIGRKLMQVSKISLGYDKPLFSDISFILSEGDRIRVHGRNGAGKSTLVKAILAQSNKSDPKSVKYAGSINIEPQTSIGVYDQEIDEKYLKLTLNLAIEGILRDRDLPIDGKRVKQLLGDYLFNPMTDGELPVSRLSGGQKARLQLISMLAGDPSILILDEPTNHLDLPSIEELEQALINYRGAIIYISHDSTFAENIGGDTIYVDGGENN